MALRKRRPPGIQAHKDARPRQGEAVPAVLSSMMLDVAREKRDLRARCAARREEAARANPDAAGLAGRRLVDTLAPSAGDLVAGYRAFRSELDPWNAMMELRRRGARLCLPVVIAPDAPLAFRTWEPGEPLEQGAFGVEIPAGGEECAPVLAVVPLLAWDREGARLGYGGGYYDRTLGALRKVRRLRQAVGFAYAAQEVPRVPRDGTDALLDALATERETLVWSNACES